MRKRWKMLNITAFLFLQLCFNKPLAVLNKSGIIEDFNYWIVDISKGNFTS